MSVDQGGILELIELQDDNTPAATDKTLRDIPVINTEAEPRNDSALSSTRVKIMLVTLVIIVVTATTLGLLFGIQVPKPVVCKETEWPCLDGVTCMDRGQRCDGYKDCPMNGEDEQGCGSTCRDYHFDCGEGMCIALHFHCSFGTQCPNGLDEINCTSKGVCLPEHFTCEDGTCIPDHQECNYFIDCPDGSDESPTLCGACNEENEFECKKGNCIPSYWRCDGFPDCVDEEDELNCGSTHGSDLYQLDVGDSVNITTPNWPDAPIPGQFMEWIISAPKESLLSIKILEANLGFQGSLAVSKPKPCLDPESTCSQKIFSRGHDHAIAEVPLYVIVKSSRITVTYRAGIFVTNRDLYFNVEVFEPSDTFPECASGYLPCVTSDEQYCIVSDRVCDENFYCTVNNCTAAENYACDGSTKVIPSFKRCDYMIDCPNLDDEMNCTCAETDFVCNSGKCIPHYFVCDFYYDCIGGYEDEMNCSTLNNTHHYELTNAETLTIRSPNYPSNAPPGSYQLYYVTVSVGHRAVITFNHFLVDWKGFLSLGTGSDVNDHGAIFAVFSHHDRPMTMYVPSSSRVFFMEFHGGPYGRSNGFEASIISIRT
nr:sortilin-related receptor-like [Lytechinus pictus]